MIFNIYAQSTPYSNLLKTIDQYPCLKDYRLEVKESKPTIEIDDLQELLGLINRIECPIIISIDDVSGYELEIYDDYRE